MTPHAAALALVVSLSVPVLAQSTLPPHQDEKTGIEDRHPGGMFSSIVTAHGQEMVMGSYRSFEIVPVKPSQTFTADVPEIFVVFHLHQHDSEFKVYGRWFVEKAEGVPQDQLLGTDAMVLTTEDESGYVSLKRPSAGWPIGQYKVEILTGTGASDMSPIGSLRFKVLPPKTAS